MEAQNELEVVCCECCAGAVLTNAGCKPVAEGAPDDSHISADYAVHVFLVAILDAPTDWTGLSCPRHRLLHAHCQPSWDGIYAHPGRYFPFIPFYDTTVA